MGCGGSRSTEGIEQANDTEDRRKSSNGTIRRVSGHHQYKLSCLCYFPYQPQIQLHNPVFHKLDEIDISGLLCENQKNQKQIITSNKD